MVLLSIKTVPLKKPKLKISRDLKIVLSSCVWDTAAGFKALGWSAPHSEEGSKPRGNPRRKCVVQTRAVLFRDIMRSYLVIMGCI